MNITLFNKKYWIRRFGEQREVRGYLTSGRSDFVASLNVHPLGTDKQLALPEGERKEKRLEAHGTDVLVVANQDTGRKGDLLYYHGDWYECINAQEWDHTILNHLNYQFVIVPRDASKSIDLKDPPTEDPSKKGEGEGVFTPDGDVRIATEDQVGFVMVKAGSGLTIDRHGCMAIDGATADELRRLFGGGGDGP